MKILMIHPHDIYSDFEPWTVRITFLAREFVKRGHEIKLVYHLLNPQSLEETRDRQEYPFQTIPLVRYQFTLLKKFGLIHELAKWADVIHFQKCFPHTSLPAIYAGYRLNKPIHYDWDDWEYEIYQYRPLNRAVGISLNTVERAIPKLVDTISVASEGLRQLCLSLGVRKDRIFEAHVGADLDRFSPDISGEDIRRYHDLEGKVVLYLGQLHGAQYLELFLRAAKVMLDRRQDVTFLVVGSGERFGELHRFTEELGIGHRVVFTGSVGHNLVPKYIALADVTVACFEDNKQTRCKSPLKIAEYLASGKAIVASDVGEVRRMVSGCGILVKPGDVGLLVDGMEKFLDDPQLTREMGRRARKRAEEKYNWSVTASNILRAYWVALEDHSFRKPY